MANKEATKNLNFRIPLTDYEDLEKIAKELGNIHLSALMRMLIQEPLEKYRKSGDPKEFLK